MAAHKLHFLYFSVGGRGEAIRLAFHVGGVEYVEENVDFQSWGAKKSSTPFGSIPVLTVDGKQLAQTNSILRYVGRLGHIYPADDAWASAKVDELCDAVEDHFGVFFGVMFGGLNAEQQKAKFEELTKEGGSIHNWAHNLDKVIATNGGSHAVGNHITTADCKIASAAANWKAPGFPADFLDHFPHIKKSVDSVNNHPKVQAYHAAKKK